MIRLSWFFLILFSISIIACSKAKPLTPVASESVNYGPQFNDDPEPSTSPSPSSSPSPSTSPSPSPSASPVATACTASWTASSFTYTVDYQGNPVAPFNTITLNLDYNQPISPSPTFSFSNAAGFGFVQTATLASSDLKHFSVTGYFGSLTSPGVYNPNVVTSQSNSSVSCSTGNLTIIKNTLPAPSISCSLQASAPAVQVRLSANNNNSVLQNPNIIFTLTGSVPINLNSFSGQNPNFQVTSTTHPNSTTYSITGNFTAFQEGDFVFSANVSGNGATTACSKTISLSTISLVDVFRMVHQEIVPGTGTIENVDWFYNYHNGPGNGYIATLAVPAFRVSKTSHADWTSPLYRCLVNVSPTILRHFVSAQSNCEGYTPDTFTNMDGVVTHLIGYGSSSNLNANILLNRATRNLNYGSASAPAYVTTFLTIGSAELNALGLGGVYSIVGSLSYVAQ